MVDNQTIESEKEKWQRSEPLNIDKIHEMVEYACEDITGVSSSQVEMNSAYNFIMVLQQMKYKKY